MKRKWSKSKKQRKYKNKKTHSKTKTRRQRGGAIVNNMDVPNERAINGNEYNVIEIEKYDDHDSLKYMYIGKARAIVVHPPCSVASRCEPPLVSYRIVDGPGILTWYNPDRTIHSVYQGEFVNGDKHGHGKNRFYSHEVFKEYEGEFDEGKMQGHGKMVLKNGDVYNGDFHDDYIHGKGTMTFHDNARYEGDWDHGNMHGKGTMTFNDNTRYEGDWDNGNMHGHGKFYDQEGTMKYDGPFANNGPVQEEEPAAPAAPPTFANNPADIFQNSQQNPPQSGNIFGSRPNFFEPPPRPPQRE